MALLLVGFCCVLDCDLCYIVLDCTVSYCVKLACIVLRHY